MNRARIICVSVFFLLGSALNLSAQNSYQVISVSDGGNIAGTVKWAGPQPRLTRLPITKDPQICDPESAKTRDLERLIIGPQGGVANTVVYLENVSRGKAFDMPEQRRFLNQKNCRYEPHILLVPQNMLLEMKSSDATLHTIHMDGAASYNLPFPFPNQIISRPMQSPGVVNLKCNGGHVWMNAEMFVAPHPYYTVTDESGTFEINNIPAGDYVIVAWHEGWSVAKQESTFDVLTEKRVQRPVFNDPKILEKKVIIKPSETAVVNFLLSEK
jgi:Polysaccharide lyase family 4, domain II